MMKFIALAIPAVIAGVVRYPCESPLLVTADEAQRQKDNGTLDGDPMDPAEFEAATDGGDGAGGEGGGSEGGADDDDGLDDLTVAELDAIIASEGVEVASNANKAAKIEAIRAKRATAPQE